MLQHTGTLHGEDYASSEFTDAFRGTVLRSTIWILALQYGLCPHERIPGPGRPKDIVEWKGPKYISQSFPCHTGTSRTRPGGEGSPHSCCPKASPQGLLCDAFVFSEKKNDFIILILNNSVLTHLLVEKFTFVKGSEVGGSWGRR